MAMPRGRLPDRIAERLREAPETFGILQLARLVSLVRAGGSERRFPGGVRYRSNPALDYPVAAVEAVEEEPDGGWTADVNLIGTLGPNGTLPWHYNEQIVRHEQTVVDGRRPSIRAFYDIFDHHFAELLCAVLARRHLALSVERGEERGLERVLNSVAGIGLPAVRDVFRDTQTFRVRQLQRFAGLLGRTPSSPQAVSQMLTAILGVRVEVRPFEGHWTYLPPASRARLGRRSGSRTRGGSGARAPRLGDWPTLGGRVWGLQGAMGVRVGPLSGAEFARFLPNGRGRSLISAALVQELILFLRLTLGANYDYKINLTVAREAIRGTRLRQRPARGAQADGVPGELPPLLGLTTWVSGRQSRDRDDPVLWVGGWQKLEVGASHG